MISAPLRERGGLDGGGLNGGGPDGAGLDAGSARRRTIAIAGIATLGLCGWLALQPDDAPESPVALPGRSAARTPRTAARFETAQPVAGWPASRPPRQPWPTLLAGGLAAWGGSAEPQRATLAVPGPAAAPAVVARQAPPFPYTLIGRLDDGQPRALLSGARRSLGVRVRDLVDTEWRVDAILPDSVRLTWLPGGVTQVLRYPAS